jgi:hypothetical protein
MRSRLNNKVKIFKLFSDNLKEIKLHPGIRFEPEFSEGYICPLCFNLFHESDLSNDSFNPLTLEDIPPKSMGGNPKLLTCRKCNSRSGHVLDNNLLKRLQEVDAREFLPNQIYKTTFKSDQGTMNGLIEMDKEGNLNLKLKSEWSSPEKSDLFIKELFPPMTIYNPLLNFDKLFEPYKTNVFAIKFPKSADERKAEIALLKTAYLLAFSILGNAFLINRALVQVREQILNPDNQIFPGIFWINFDFPDTLRGINLIKSPKELRCFLIIFDLKTKSKKRQFAIALPGPSLPGISVYENIEKICCDDSVDEYIHLELEHLKDLDYVKETKNAWGAIWFWQKYCSE